MCLILKVDVGILFRYPVKYVYFSSFISYPVKKVVHNTAATGNLHIVAKIFVNILELNPKILHNKNDAIFKKQTPLLSGSARFTGKL